MKTKICKICGVEKHIDEFYKKKNSKDGYMNQCKECKIMYSRKYRKENKDKVKETKRKHYLEHQDEVKQKRMEYYYENREEINERRKEYGKKYYQENKKIWRLNEHRRYAMLKLLPKNLTNNEWDEIMEYFDYKCVVTGSSEDLSLEHFIPLSSGHGGTTIENCYPMNRELNISKNGCNPFEWIERQTDDIKNNFYNVLIPYLANKNRMSVDEFIEYVNWCMNNKRSVEQTKIDNENNLTSLDLFIQYKLDNE